MNYKLIGALALASLGQDARGDSLRSCPYTPFIFLVKIVGSQHFSGHSLSDTGQS